MRTLAFVVVLLVLAGCAGQPGLVPASPTPPAAAALQFYRTPTLTPSRAPLLNQPSATPLPTPTPTPRTHTVRLGEDMSGIALRYRVSLDALKTANPSANPRIIIVGQQLIIPAATGVPGTPTATAAPVRISVDAPHCWIDASGGVWCFTMVNNQSPHAVENTTIKLSLLDENGKPIAEQSASTALNYLPAGASSPMAVFFPAPLPQTLRPQAQYVSALPAEQHSARYLPVEVKEQKINFAANQLSADVTALLALAPGVQASQARVVLAAYGAEGSLVGMRLWESSAAWQGGTLPVSLSVYSLGGKILRVAVLVEARP